MPFYQLAAEHTQAKSVEHPCENGVFNDPAEALDDVVECDSPEDAEQYGFGLIEEDVLKEKRCQCDKWDEAGSDSWWKSVVVSAVEQKS